MGAGDGHDRLEYVVRGSHRGLVPALLGTPGGSPVVPVTADGIVVVPVSRRQPVLETPARIARDLGWPLLLLCSHGNQARRARELVLAVWPEVDVTAADLLHNDLLHAPGEWASDRHPAARERRDVDTNRKRNLGLAAARMTRREYVLFVDDDVLRFAAPHVTHAVRHVRSTGRSIASWALEYFPDNSVVHHARRDFLGLHQDVFLGGAALLVRIEDRVPPAFPPIYNEDWLFLYEPIARGEVVAGPDVGQLSLDPYATPERAGEEEFGDVLGEGLFHLLHLGEHVGVARDPRYWRPVHAKRTKLLHRVTGELRRRLGAAEPGEQARVIRALAAIDGSRRQLTRATPESLADFVRRWQHDEELWRRFYERLPRRETLKEALVYLGLHDAWIVEARPAA